LQQHALIRVIPRVRRRLARRVDLTLVTSPSAAISSRARRRRLARRSIVSFRCQRSRFAPRAPIVGLVERHRAHASHDARGAGSLGQLVVVREHLEVGFGRARGARSHARGRVRGGGHGCGFRCGCRRAGSHAEASRCAARARRSRDDDNSRRYLLTTKRRRVPIQKPIRSPTRHIDAPARRALTR
jgi:hypothetical protein